MNDIGVKIAREAIKLLKVGNVTYIRKGRINEAL